MGLTDPISGPFGTLEYDHSDGISITGGFVYRGSAMPQLYGKYIFGDLALQGSPVRANGRMFYADLTSGEILEFLLPQFVDGKIPNGLTVHGFGEDADGELYAMVTNTPANGVGGLVYKLTQDLATPTLIELFRASPTPEGIRVEWQLSDPGRFQSIALERSAQETGPWSRVGQTPQIEGRVTSVLDTQVASGEEQWYRLSGAYLGGQSFAFGPISATAQGSITAFELSPLSPNPSNGHSIVTFSVPATTRVRLTLVDVQGREAAVLSDGMRSAGRHTAALEAGDLRAGMYFVRLQAKGVQLVRRLALTR